MNCEFMIISKYLHFDDKIKSCSKNFNVIFEFNEKKTTKINQFVFDYNEKWFMNFESFNASFVNNL